MPSGRTLVLRTAIIHNNSGSTSSLMYLLINGTTGASAIWAGALAANARAALSEWVVLNPGDYIGLYKDSGASPVVTLFGALLLGSPS